MFLKERSSPEWEHEGRGEGRTGMNSIFLKAASKTHHHQPEQTWTSQMSYNPLVSVSYKIRGWLCETTITIKDLEIQKEAIEQFLITYTNCNAG